MTDPARVYSVLRLTGLDCARCDRPVITPEILATATGQVVLVNGVPACRCMSPVDI